jgi:hypothetical protein
MKDSKMTVIGPVDVVAKLRKASTAEISSVGPWPEKKDGGDKKDGGGDKKDAPKQLVFYPPPWYAQQPYHHPQYVARSIEEDPNSCVICWSGFGRLQLVGLDRQLSRRS